MSYSYGRRDYRFARRSLRLHLLNLPARRCVELVVNLLWRDQGRTRVEAVLGPDHCQLAVSGDLLMQVEGIRVNSRL